MKKIVLGIALILALAAAIQPQASANCNGYWQFWDDDYVFFDVYFAACWSGNYYTQIHQISPEEYYAGMFGFYGD